MVKGKEKNTIKFDKCEKIDAYIVCTCKQQEDEFSKGGAREMVE